MIFDDFTGVAGQNLPLDASYPFLADAPQFVIAHASKREEIRSTVRDVVLQLASASCLARRAHARRSRLAIYDQRRKAGRQSLNFAPFHFPILSSTDGRLDQPSCSF